MKIRHPDMSYHEPIADAPMMDVGASTLKEAAVYCSVPRPPRGEGRHRERKPRVYWMEFESAEVLRLEKAIAELRLNYPQVLGDPLPAEVR